MILMVHNKQSNYRFVLINRSPWLIRDTGVAAIPYIFKSSVLTVQANDINHIKQLRKQFAPLVANQDELHLGEIIHLHYPELFI